MRLTAEKMAVGGAILRIGDMVYSPLPTSVSRMRSLREWAPRQQWFKDLVAAGRLGQDAELLPWIAIEELYLRARGSSDREPDWVKNLSPEILGQLRARWMLGDGFDPLALLPSCQNLGFGYGVEADGLIHDVCSSLGVFRLSNIRQLGFLHDPVVRESVHVPGIGVAMPFEHTRYCHSLDVMAVATLIGTNVGLCARDLAHLRVAAVSHDVLTPAGGDSVKLIDPEAFDEDAHYPEAFVRAQAHFERERKRYSHRSDDGSWRQVRERHGLDEELLTSIVRGQGVLGRLLDIADKCAYVARDVDMYTMRTDPRTYQVIAPPDSLLEIWDITQEGKYPCGVWDCVQVVGDKVVFTDGNRLARFLRLRMLMFKHLYYKAEARYMEQLVATAVSDHLYASGVLTRDMLLTMSDCELEAFINRATGTENAIWGVSSTGEAPVVERFLTIEEAKQREAQLLAKADEPLLTMVDPFYTSISTGVGKFLVKKGRKIVPFAEAQPGDATEIAGLAHDPAPVRLYYLLMREAGIPPKLQQSLLSRQRQRLAKS